jgi:uncharacterized membrane protein
MASKKQYVVIVALGLVGAANGAVGGLAAGAVGVVAGAMGGAVAFGLLAAFLVWVYNSRL